MKTRYLFGALLGGALLAACTADDALELNQAAQGVNPSAPVFSVHFDDADLLTRAEFVEGDSWKVNFDDGDLLSLYHGVTLASPNYEFKGYQNAIYEGKNDGTDGFVFSTNSMVNPGSAILIWPANTEKTWLDRQAIGAPLITIDLDQDAETKEKTPYMSEFLSLTNWDSKTGEDAPGYGHGKSYDIALKKVGSQFILNMEFENFPKLPKEVSAIRIISVELDGNGDNVFTNAIPVKALETASVVYNDKKGDESHLTWKNQSDLDLEAATGEAKIKTKDVNVADDQKTGTAIFTLLPTNTTIKEGEGDATQQAGRVVINTTYGSVTLGEIAEEEVAEEEKIWRKSRAITDETEWLTVTEGLNSVLKESLWAESKKGTFYNTEEKKGENIGAFLNRFLKVDMSKLDMNNMHIDNEDDLMDAIAVYEALEIEDEVTFILDGDDDKKFYMSKETWDKVAKLDKSKVKIAACNKSGEVCTTVVLQDGEGDDVPELSFAITTTNGDKVQSAVDIELDGTWTFNATQEKAKTLNRVHTLTVLAESELNLTSTTVNVKNNITATAYAFELVNNGTVNIEGDVYLMNKMTNHGTISIPVTDANGEKRFLMYTGGKLTNCEDAVYDRNFEEGWWTLTPETPTSVLKNAGGVIDNHGTLAIVTGSGGTVENYGTINIWETTARTLITTNQDATANITQPYSKSNRFGTINLQKAGVGVDNLTINSGKNGFVKYATSIGASCDLRNYVVVDTDTNVPNTKCDYIEIQYAGKDLRVSNSVTATALIIPKGRSIFLPNATGSSLTINSYIYLKGTITHAKEVKGEYRFEKDYGYFGCAEKDKNNMFSMLSEE